MDFFFAPFPRWLDRLAHACCGLCLGVAVLAALQRVGGGPLRVDWADAVLATALIYGAGLLVYLATGAWRRVRGGGW